MKRQPRASKKAPAAPPLGLAEISPEKALELLPGGVRVPLQLFTLVGEMLCNPMLYRRQSAGELMRLADEMNGLLDKQLRQAQELGPQLA